MKKTLADFGFNEFQERILFPERTRQSSLDIKNLFPAGSISLEQANFNFSSDTVVGGIAIQTTSNTSFVDVTDLTLNFSLPVKTRTLFFWQVAAYIQGQWDNNVTRAVNARLVIDDEQIGEIAEISGTPLGNPTTFVVAHPIMMHQAIELNAGSHTAKLQFKTTNGSFQAVIFNEKCRITFIKLG